MTVRATPPLELRLRERIDTLTDERDRERARRLRLARRVAAMYQGQRRCVYCGHHCHGLTCADHRDLPRIDAFYEGSG